MVDIKCDGCGEELGIDEIWREVYKSFHCAKCSNEECEKDARDDKD